jgi:hypothetical protein
MAEGAAAEVIEVEAGEDIALAAEVEAVGITGGITGVTAMAFMAADSTAPSLTTVAS